MKTCTYCQHITEDYVNFCPVCGQPLTAPQPTQTPSAAKPKQPAKVKSIVGFALSINGLVGAGVLLLSAAYIWFIYMWGTMMMHSDGYYDPDLLSAWSILRACCLLLGFSGIIECLPCAIIGRMFGNKALAAGNTSKLAQLAAKLGLFGIIATAVLFVNSILIAFAMR